MHSPVDELITGSDGIHVGQTDTPLEVARKLIGPDAVIGQSVSTPEDAARAVELGADYVGIGAVWFTTSKDLKGKQSMGPYGVGTILDVLAGTGVQAVAIGGIHLSNLAHLLHSSVSPEKQNRLDGVAVISDIVGSTQPEQAARKLADIVSSFKSNWATPTPGIFRAEEDLDKDKIIAKVGELLEFTRSCTPLVNQVSFSRCLV